MTRSIVHRGPDDEGYYVSGSLGRFLADPEMKPNVKREHSLRATRR